MQAGSLTLLSLLKLPHLRTLELMHHCNSDAWAADDRNAHVPLHRARGLMGQQLLVHGEEAQQIVNETRAGAYKSCIARLVSSSMQFPAKLTDMCLATHLQGT